MRRILIFFTVLFLLFFVVGLPLLLSGCSSFASSLIVSAVDDYCAVPAADRAAYRALINSRTSPNRVAIDCGGVDE